MSEFRETAPSAPAVFYRSYSRRKADGTRESYKEAIARTVGDLADIGGLTDEQRELCLDVAQKQHAFPSGRALWVAGTEWAKKPENFYGYYNCSGAVLTGPHVFGRLMDMAMCGTGTGLLLERELVEALPTISTKLVLGKVIDSRDIDGGDARTLVIVDSSASSALVSVGDSRKGWVDAYQSLINLAFEPTQKELQIELNLSQVRGKGRRLKGFGGVANPAGLRTAFEKIIGLLGNAFGRRLTTVEACLLVDEAASAVVAGNLRRSAGIRLFSSDDEEAKNAKQGLYKQDENGNWSVDPKRESLRLANHTVCYHHRPTLNELKESVRKQFLSGEGAIQFSPEAIARANADLLDSAETKKRFIETYTSKGKEAGKKYIKELADANDIECDDRQLEHRILRYSANPCHEIIGNDFMCNLGEVHLNTINPVDKESQHKAFYATGLMVASLLQHRFPDKEIQYSREQDPIVAVCLSGLFDFFVSAFGVEWLDWMAKGRKTGSKYKKFTQLEREYLESWKYSAWQGVSDYCVQAGLKMPNRYTAVQPAGSKSLLTGASPGWHPPKAQRFIRRITFGIDDPLVAALRDYGYNVVPAQSARDDDGNLLNDINDPRVHEVLVEIPTEVPWASLPGADAYDLSRIPVESQMGLYMQVQRYYSTHTTSATIEFRENEIDTLAKLVYDQIHNDCGYIGVAMLARFDANETFPRLPFEPIDKQTYDRLMARIRAHRAALPQNVTILDLLKPYDRPDHVLEPQDTACANSACVAKIEQEETMGLV